MTDVCIRGVVEAIHSSHSSRRLYSDGASQALGMSVSTTVLEAVLPYSRMSMIQLLGKERQIISNQSYFYKKAEIYPHSAFLIDADTAAWARLIDPKYFDGDYGKMVEVLSGCTFLIAGHNVKGVFKALEDFDIPELQHVCVSTNRKVPHGYILYQFKEKQCGS